MSTVICPAEGWFVEYDDGTFLRVCYFVRSSSDANYAYVSKGGRIDWSGAFGKVVDMWHIHDDR